MLRPRLLFVTLLSSLAASSCGMNLTITAPVQPEQRTAAAVDEAQWAPAGQDPDAPTVRQGPDGGAAPSVQITDPVPSPLFVQILPAQTTIHWTSEDPDGPGPGPKAYYYRFIPRDDPEFDNALIDPVAFRELHSPDYVGWTKVKGSVESVPLPSLDITQLHLFVITAVDRRGNDDPAFSTARNMLIFGVDPSAVTGGASETAEERSPGGRR